MKNKVAGKLLKNAVVVTANILFAFPVFYLLTLVIYNTSSSMVTVFSCLGVCIIFTLLNLVLVRELHIKNKISIVFVLIGLVGAIYTASSIFLEANTKIHYYYKMKNVSADNYYSFSDYFDSSLNFSDIFHTLNTVKAKDYFIAKDSDNNESVWQYLDFDNILGKTESEALQSYQKSKSEDAYSYTFEYRKLTKITVISLLTNPSELYSQFKGINSSGCTLGSNKVSGAWLWTMWISFAGLIIIVPVVSILFAQKKSS